MTTKTRLKRMEAQTGLDRPCHLCGVLCAEAAGIGEYLLQQGMKLPLCRLAEEQCVKCGRLKLCNARWLDGDADAIFHAFAAEIKLARREQREPSDKAESQRRFLLARLEEYEHSIYGEHYVGAKLAGIDAVLQYTAQHCPDLLAEVERDSAIEKQELLEGVKANERK